MRDEYVREVDVQRMVDAVCDRRERFVSAKETHFVSRGYVFFSGAAAGKKSKLSRSGYAYSLAAPL